MSTERWTHDLPRLQARIRDPAPLVLSEGSVSTDRGLGAVRGTTPVAALADGSRGPLDIASQLAREVMYINDEHWHPETEQERWHRVRAWVVSQLSTAPASTVETEPTK